MNTAAGSIPQSPNANAERMFPRFTAAQVARLAAHGRRRPMQRGDILFDAGQSSTPFFVVTCGQVEIVRPSSSGDARVAVHGPGEFTGEANMLDGRRSLSRGRVAEAGEVIEIDRERLLALVQTDAEISEILMRAFILRRVHLIARGFGDVILIGSSHCPGTLRVKEFLTRNAHPYTYLDLDRDTDVQALFDRFHVTQRDVPVVVCHGEVALRNPRNDAIAECLGFNPELNSSEVHDLIVVGAGPSGLAAAVYAASEGLNVLVLEESAPGGQAGSSSKIENYLGFPTGISGQVLAGRALAQAQKFGAQVLIAKSAKRLTHVHSPYRIEIGGGASVRARALVIATGAEYRKPAVENLPRFEGVGVYYAATFMEAQLCLNRNVFVIGGATPPAKPRCSWRKRAATCTSWRARAGCPRRCRPTSFAASRTIRTSQCMRTLRSSPWKATGIASACIAVTTRAAWLRPTTSSTCSSWPAPYRRRAGSTAVWRSTPGGSSRRARISRRRTWLTRNGRSPALPTRSKRACRACLQSVTFAPAM